MIMNLIEFLESSLRSGTDRELDLAFMNARDVKQIIAALRAAEKMATACVRFNNPTDEGPRLHDIINDALKAWNEATK